MLTIRSRISVPCVAKMIETPQIRRMKQQKKQSLRRLKIVLHDLSENYEQMKKFERNDRVKEITLLAKHLDGIESSLETYTRFFLDDDSDEFV